MFDRGSERRFTPTLLKDEEDDGPWWCLGDLRDGSTAVMSGPRREDVSEEQPTHSGGSKRIFLDGTCVRLLDTSSGVVMS